VADVLQAAEAGESAISVPSGECIVTPGARDKAESLEIELLEEEGGDVSSEPAPACASSGGAAVSGETAPTGASPEQGAETEGSGDAEEVVRQVCSLIESRLPASLAGTELEGLVREVVIAKLGGTDSASGDGTESRVGGVCLINGSRLLEGGAGPVPVDEKVLLADAIGGDEDVPLAGGYMEWEKASFRRTVESPEISVIVDGELHLTVGGKTLVGKAGDMLYFPKGVNVLYSTPSKVRVACINAAC
jgi:ethanolamine utilization protein EutQ